MAASHVRQARSVSSGAGAVGGRALRALRSFTIEILASGPHSSAAAPVAKLEPISMVDTCATEARWDAVLGGSRRRIDSMLGATDNEMRQDRPVPCGVAARTVVCCVTLLDHI